MKRYCLKLYRQMEKEIVRCKEETFCRLEKIETCFQFAASYWSRVKQKLEVYAFRKEKNEIEFFKNIKPLFTSQLEYYSLLYYSELFQPEDFAGSIEFWTGEFRRLEKFEHENRDFLLCINKEDCDMMPYNFLRRYYYSKNIHEQKLYDGGIKVSTNGDHLIAMWLALRNYRLYVTLRLHDQQKDPGIETAVMPAS